MEQGCYFVVAGDSVSFGVEGDRSDFPNLFGEEDYEIEIEADVYYTEEEVIRGWGAVFKKVILMNYKKVE